MSFESLNLNPAIRQALAAAGYTEPTPVQAKAIPDAIAGHDLMVSAPTGTGKTAALCCRHCSAWRNPPGQAADHACWC